MSDNKYKELNDVERENKEYHFKVTQMNNRIKKLKMQQDELNKRINTLETIENQKKEIVKFKQMIQNEKTESKINTGKMIEVKRSKVAKDKESRSQSIQLSRAKYYTRKQQQFDKSRAEHLVSSSMLTQYFSHKANLNKYKIVKAKMSQIKYKADKEKQKADEADKKNEILQNRIQSERDKAIKLKKELSKLEKYEAECLNQLNMTMNTKNELLKSTNCVLYDGFKFNKNPSCIFPNNQLSSIDSKHNFNNSMKNISGIIKPGSACSSKTKPSMNKIENY